MTEAIEQLSEEQRSTITLFYLQRHTYEQIIERTGYTFMQVKSYIQNGRRNLKTILSKKLGNTRP
jgi:RNA polymerase sigma-70 factor (ECF subfamily)